MDYFLHFWSILLFLHVVFYVEGYSKEGKAHRNFVFAKMSEATIAHIPFCLSKNCFGFYTSLISMFYAFFYIKKRVRLF